MSQIKDNLDRVRSRIAAAAERSGRRPEDVRLVAVSKTVGAEMAREALAAGQTLFGESRVQEARDKIPAVGGDARWHMIGRLQKNKAKYIPGLFTMVHSVDSFELAEALDHSMAKAVEKGIDLKSHILDILIQVNVSGEQSKGGATEMELVGLLKEISKLSFLKVRGLMTIPPFYQNQEDSRSCFRKLNELRVIIETDNIPHVEMTELSMGMSNDFEVAIEEGATLVRVGSALFGER